MNTQLKEDKKLMKMFSNELTFNAINVTDRYFHAGAYRISCAYKKVRYLLTVSSEKINLKYDIDNVRKSFDFTSLCEVIDHIKEDKQ